jgi:hypothetical protein
MAARERSSAVVADSLEAVHPTAVTTSQPPPGRWATIGSHDGNLEASRTTFKLHLLTSFVPDSTIDYPSPTAIRLRHRRDRCIATPDRTHPIASQGSHNIQRTPRDAIMQVSNMLAEPRVSGAHLFPESVEELIAGQHHTSRESVSEYDMLAQEGDSSMMDVYPSTETASAHDSLSPTKQVQPKHVSFELLLPQTPQTKARLPMRVNIYPHDTTDSIITTVKNFYGLYQRRGVIFEDRHGTTLIARFENFEHGMVVYVRVSTEELDAEEYSPAPHQATVSPRRPRPHLDEAFQMLPPIIHHQASMRADSRNGRRTQSPHPGRGRRSASASTHAKRMRPSAKSRGNSSHGSFAEADGYSDSDGSVSSSRRSRKEPLASADISVDNIVEGGRRKRAKFDSSVSHGLVGRLCAVYLTMGPLNRSFLYSCLLRFR